jgi:hypothetical protein
MEEHTSGMWEKENNDRSSKGVFQVSEYSQPLSARMLDSWRPEDGTEQRGFGMWQQEKSDCMSKGIARP